MKQRTAFLTFLSLWVCTFSGCDSSRIGVLYDTSGNPVPGTAVRLLSVDDEGNEVTQLDFVVTNDSGEFEIGGEDGNAGLILEATVSDSTLRGFHAGASDKISIHPLTNALAGLVFDITESEGGRSTADFSADELRDIADSIFNEDSSSLDLADAPSLQEFVREIAGREIALAAGGEIAGKTSEAFETSQDNSTITFASNTNICPIGYFIHPFESSTFTFDVRPDGTLCGGTGGDLSSMLAPTSMAFEFPPGTDSFFAGGTSYPLGGASTDVENEREVILGPYALESPSNPGHEDTLEVSRKIFVPNSGDYVRYLEILENTGSQAREVTFQIRSTLLTGSESELLTNDNAPSSASVSDRFLAAFDSGADRPTVGWSIQDGLGVVAVEELNAPGTSGGNVGDVSYAWSITIAPGKSQIFVHYLYINASRSAEETYDRLQQITEAPDMSDMTLEELSQIQNFTPGTGTIVGEAGSVIGTAEVTGENTRTGQSLTVTARRDGSFALPLEAESGDGIQITASDGLDQTIVVH